MSQEVFDVNPMEEFYYISSHKIINRSHCQLQGQDSACDQR